MPNFVSEVIAENVKLNDVGTANQKQYINFKGTISEDGILTVSGVRTETEQETLERLAAKLGQKVSPDPTFNKAPEEAPAIVDPIN